MFKYKIQFYNKVISICFPQVAVSSWMSNSQQLFRAAAHRRKATALGCGVWLSLQANHGQAATAFRSWQPGFKVSEVVFFEVTWSNFIMSTSIACILPVFFLDQEWQLNLSTYLLFCCKVL